MICLSVSILEFLRELQPLLYDAGLSFSQGMWLWVML